MDKRGKVRPELDEVVLPQVRGHDLSSLSFRDVLKEAGISTNYDNCSSLGRKLAEYVTVVKDFP